MNVPAQQRILLVDDEESILSSFRRLLRREAYEVITAGSGPEALKIMQEQPVNLIISDQRMPQMMGTELLKKVRDQWPDTLRIILSGYSEVNTIINAVNDGEIYKYITKPWNDEELKLNIRRALEQYGLEAQNRNMTKKIEQQNKQLRQLNDQLAQQAKDVSAGMACVQELLELIDIAVLVVDSQGLIVHANRKVGDIFSLNESGFIGLSARANLPNALYQALFESFGSKAVVANGRLELAGRRLQWRCRELAGEKQFQSSLITIWEEVQ